MREFNIKKGTFVKDSNSTFKIMTKTLLCLLIISIYGILVITFKKYDTTMLLRGIIIILIPIIISVLTEYLWYLIKKDKKKFTYLIRGSYAYLTGLILGLIIPLNTNYLVLIIVTIFITLIKLLMGGFGKNIVNPPLIGWLIIFLITKNNMQIDYTNFNPQLLFNNTSDSIGAICPLLSILSLIYLIFKKSIKGIIPFTGLMTILIITFIYSLVNNISLTYPVMNIIEGSLIFGLVFVASDTITTPLTKKGQFFSGFLIGLFVFLIRLYTPINDGSLLVILIVSILNILIRKLEIWYNLNS